MSDFAVGNQLSDQTLRFSGRCSDFSSRVVTLDGGLIRRPVLLLHHGRHDDGKRYRLPNLVAKMALPTKTPGRPRESPYSYRLNIGEFNKFRSLVCGTGADEALSRSSELLATAIAERNRLADRLRWSREVEEVDQPRTRVREAEALYAVAEVEAVAAIAARKTASDAYIAGSKVLSYHRPLQGRLEAWVDALEAVGGLGEGVNALRWLQSRLRRPTDSRPLVPLTYEDAAKILVAGARAHDGRLPDPAAWTQAVHLQVPSIGRFHFGYGIKGRKLPDDVAPYTKPFAPILRPPLRIAEEAEIIARLVILREKDGRLATACAAIEEHFRRTHYSETNNAIYAIRQLVLREAYSTAEYLQIDKSSRIEQFIDLLDISIGKALRSAFLDPDSLESYGSMLRKDTQESSEVA